MVSKSDAIIIVGGGAFGLSTALHLSQNGYTNVSVFEKDNHIPPRYSAANDLNKIVRAEYEDPFYTELTIVRSSKNNSSTGHSTNSSQCTESHRSVENTPLRPSLPPNRFPTLRIWRSFRESRQYITEIPRFGGEPPQNQSARFPAQRRRRYPSDLLAA